MLGNGLEACSGYFHVKKKRIKKMTSTRQGSCCLVKPKHSGAGPEACPEARRPFFGAVVSGLCRHNGARSRCRSRGQIPAVHLRSTHVGIAGRHAYLDLFQVAII